VANVMKEGGSEGGGNLLRRNWGALALQRSKGILHERHGSEGMPESRVIGAWKDKKSHAKLPNPTESLHLRGPYEIENERSGHGDKSVNRIGKYFQNVLRMDSATVRVQGLAFSPVGCNVRIPSRIV